MMLVRDQPREHGHAAGLDHEIVIAAAIFDAAHLDHAQAAALGAIVLRALLERR